MTLVMFEQFTQILPMFAHTLEKANTWDSCLTSATPRDIFELVSSKGACDRLEHTSGKICYFPFPSWTLTLELQAVLLCRSPEEYVLSDAPNPAGRRSPWGCSKVAQQQPELRRRIFSSSINLR